MKISDRHIWRRKKFTPDQKRLEHRRETLRRFLEMDAPDIIVWHSARLLIDGMDAHHGGKKWRTSTMRQKIMAWWKYTVRAKATFAAMDREEKENDNDNG